MKWIHSGPKYHVRQYNTVHKMNHSFCTDFVTVKRKICTFFLAFQLLTASVQEDGYELSLTLTFALRGGKDKFAGKKLGITGDYLSLYTEQDNQTTYRSDSDGRYRSSC